MQLKIGITMYNLVSIKEFARYVALSLLSKGYSVSPLKLQKILYYQQAWHMVFFGRKNPLFIDAPEAWVNGPVYPVIYRQYKDMVPGMCDHLKLDNFGVKDEKELPKIQKGLSNKLSLTADEFGLLESVNNLYGSKTQNQLILATHSEKPWIDARGDLLPFEFSKTPISLDTMYAYYKERYDRNRAK